MRRLEKRAKGGLDLFYDGMQGRVLESRVGSTKLASSVYHSNTRMISNVELYASWCHPCVVLRAHRFDHTLFQERHISGSPPKFPRSPHLIASSQGEAKTQRK